MADRRALLGQAPGNADTSMDQSDLEDDVVDSSCWLMEPESSISRTNAFARVADLQSSSDSFCLICGRGCHSSHPVMRNSSNSKDLAARCQSSSSNSSADKPPVARPAAGQNSRITIYVNSTDQDITQGAASPLEKLSLPPRSKSRSLGVFTSAIIRQLWDIHRLLLALLQETSTLNKRRDSVADEWHGRSLCAVEMPLDTTSATSTNQNMDGGQPPQTTAIQSQRYLGRETTPLSKPELSDRIQQKRQQMVSFGPGRRPTTVTSRLASECSFACAHTSAKQMCFASTVCIGRVSNARTAEQVTAECRTMRSGDSRSQNSVSQDRFTALNRRFLHQFHHSCTAPRSSSHTGVFAPASLFSRDDVIVFHRALQDSPISGNNVERRQQLVVTLSRLKSRINAIKFNLTESVSSEVVARKSVKRRGRSRTKGSANLYR